MGCPYCGEGAEWDVHNEGMGLGVSSSFRFCRTLHRATEQIEM